MKHKLMIALALATLSMSIFAQVNIDPEHSIYKYIYIWENKGYIENLPPQKPYPLPFLKTLLNSVITHGSIQDKEIAEKFLLECENRAALTTEGNGYLVGDGKGMMSSIMLTGRSQLTDNVSIGVKVGSYVTKDESFNTDPLFHNRNFDYNTDVSNLGPFELLSSLNSMASFSTEKLWLQAGMTRSSFGPFFDDNIMMSPEAPQTGYVNFNWYITENLIFTHKLHQLLATDLQGDPTDGIPDKYLSSHGLQFQALPWLNIGVFESVLWGGRFDLLYLLPFSQLMYSQGVNNFIDNYLIGVTGEIELPKNVNVKGIFFVDDFGFNETMKLNFDTKYKFGFETRVNWAPEMPVLNIVEVGYTMLTPHMYTHEPAGERDTNDTITYDWNVDHQGSYNYLNYTTQGKSLGTQMRPNSDKISLKAKFRLPFKVDLDVFADLIRNANSNEDLPDEFQDMKIIKNDDGTYFTDLNENGDRDDYWVYVNKKDVRYYESNDDGTPDITDTDINVTDPKKPDYIELKQGTEPLYLGDGSVNDHGVVVMDRFSGKHQNHWRYLWSEKFPFLQQDIFQTFQTGMSLSRKWYFDNFDFKTVFNYTYQNHRGDSENFIHLGVTANF